MFWHACTFLPLPLMPARNSQYFPPSNMLHQSAEANSETPCRAICILGIILADARGRLPPLGPLPPALLSPRASDAHSQDVCKICSSLSEAGAGCAQACTQVLLAVHRAPYCAQPCLGQVHELYPCVPSLAVPVVLRADED